MARRPKLTLEATENGSYVVKCVFKDERGIAVNPVTLAWRLTDSAGTVVNSRTAVAVAVPTAITYVPMTGADLAILEDGDHEVRVFTVVGTYYSTLTTSTLDFTADTQFDVRNLIGVT